MRILFISKYIWFQRFKDPTRHYFLAKAMAEAGNTVMLVGSRSNAGKSPRFFGLKDVWQADGLTNVMLNGPLISYGMNAGRVLSWILFEIMVVLQALNFRRYRPEVVMVSSLSILTMLTGVFLKHLLNAKLVIEVRDIHPLTLVEVGGFNPSNIFVRIFAWVEKFSYRRADLLVSPLENFGEHVASVISDPPPFVWIPMGFDDTMLTDTVSQNGRLVIDQLSKIKSEGRFIIGYAGAIGVANDLERVFRAIGDDRFRSIHFAIIGDGPLKQAFQTKYGELTNVTFFDRIPKSDVASVLARCDLLLGMCMDLPIYRFGVSPNKWIDYALARRPFITNLDANLLVIKQSQNAFVASDGGDEAFRGEIVRVAGLPAMALNEMGQKGYDFVTSNLSYRQLAQKLVSAFSRVLSA